MVLRVRHTPFRFPTNVPYITPIPHFLLKSIWLLYLLISSNSSYTKEISVRLFVNQSGVVAVISETLESFGLSIQDEVTDVNWPAPQRAHYRASIINLFSKQGI